MIFLLIIHTDKQPSHASSEGGVSGPRGGTPHMPEHYLCLVQFLHSFAPREEIKGSSEQKIKASPCS